MNELHQISLRERIRLNLISAMDKANINQVQLAEKLGISKGTVNNWARGNNSPDVDMVPKICHVLGISILSLYAPTKFEELESITSIRKSEPITDDEIEHIKKYRTLDEYGKQAVDSILNIEYTRALEIQKQTSHKEITAESPVLFYPVPEYSEPVSAGTGRPIDLAYPENIMLIKEPPRGTSFIAHVNGDSMDPTFQDGDMVFVHAQNEIKQGQIGIFFMDGQEFIKELGDGELISHNSKYESIELDESIRCQGLVLGICDESYFED